MNERHPITHSPSDGTCWQAFLSRNGTPMMVLDANGIVTDLNPAAAAMLPGEVRGRTLLACVQPEEAQALREALDRARASLEAQAYEVEARPAHASEAALWVAGQVVPLGPDGGFSGAIVLRTDISERRHNEMCLRDIKARWRSITENTTDTFIVADGADRIRYINRTLPPSTPDSVLETSLYLYQFEEDHDLIRSTLRLVRETGQPAGYETKLDMQALGIDEPPRWFVTKVVPITGQDDPGGVILVASDITERKAIERDLRASEERWSSLTGNTDDVIQVIDRNGIIRYINKALPPTTVEGVLGTSIYHWVVPDDADMIRETLGRVLDTAITETYETRIDMSAFGLPGESLWYSVKVVPTTTDDDVSGAILIASNVTKAKRSEEALRRAKEMAEAASSAKSTFLANMSHEVRTPLNAIIGLTNLALRAEGGPKVADYLRKVRASSRTLLGILDDILDFSRIEAGKLTLETEDFDLRELFENLGDLIGHQAQRKGIEFLVDVDPSMPTALRGDALRINQVLTNLAYNAVKFTEQGHIVIAARSEGQGTRRRFRLSVTDTGIGITPENVPRLFESFSQLDSSTTRTHGGSGLGLAICQHLAHLMGGTLELRSELGRGSVFTFHVDLDLQPEPPSPPCFVPDPRIGTRVLVVDDNPLAAQILTDTLGAFGLQVVTVASGEEALQAARASREGAPFGLVVLDWKMANIDGLETARTLTEQTPEGDYLPKLILATAYDYPKLRSLAREVGIDEVLPKPASQSSLFDAVMRALGELAPPSRPPSRTSIPERSLEGIRVLVAEDVEINQLIVQEILEDAGATVVLASDGREAVAAAQDQPVDAVLMDLQMPGMDGFEAARTLRAEPAFSRLPIIALTAHALRGDRERCLAAGMNDHVTKPIHAPTLIATVRQHVARAGNPSVSPPPVLESSPPPRSLPGVDLADALDHFGGNLHTYRALLDGFLNHYGRSASDLRDAIRSEDTSKVRDIVHALVGVAGNLRLRTVYSRALELQALLRRDAKADIPRALTLLEAALEEAALSIASLPNASRGRHTFPRDLTALGHTVPRDFRTALDALQALLERNSLDGRGAIQELRRTLTNGPHDRALEAIEASVERLDFRTARTRLAALRTALGPEEVPAS